jgi:epoxyqueuosine reductase
LSSNVRERLLERARHLGFDLCGVCDAVPAPHVDPYREWLDRGFGGSMDYLRRHLPLKEHPGTLLPGVRSIVAVGLNYNQPNPARPGHPRIARYALGRDYHKVLRGKLRSLGSWLEREVQGAQTRACVDSAPIFERDYARLAGLGWFGKNTMLINSRRGSWFFIGLLLTTAEIPPDEPAIGGCGTCTRCIDACPTGAIVQLGERWQVDARRCISYLTIEHRGAIDSDLAKDVGEWTFGCDVCQEVCPFNQPRASQPLRAAYTQEPDFLQTRDWPSLEEVAQLGDEPWDVLTRGSAIRRTGAAGIRRNATLNLLNRSRL